MKKVMLRDDGTPIMEGFVVLSERKMENTFHSPIENSFSLDVSPNFCQFCWSSEKATSNFGGSFSVDGMEHAKRMKAFAERELPDFPFVIWNIHDPLIPVEIDWVKWEKAMQPAKTLSGVADKFLARNVPFKCKEEEIA